MKDKYLENTFSGRTLALQVLEKIDSRNAYANLALQEVLAQHSEAEQREKGFCTELVYGTLRHLLKIDYLLGRLLSRPLASLKPLIKNNLRIALYQLIYLPDIPERAVCHSAVEIIKQSKYTGLAGLVNGVLRSYLRQGQQITLPDQKADLAGFLSIEYSHPHWLVERWLNNFGVAKTNEILLVDNEEPPITVRINEHRTTINQVKTELQENGIELIPGLFLNEAISLRKIPASVERLAVFSEGKIYIQDENAMLVGRLLQPVAGETIIDLCAAPGGKSTQLAELMKDQGKIISVDDHPHKIELIKENTARLGLTIIKPCLGDARQFTLTNGELADAVLVDAPCSGTGVLRRRVDLRYKRQPADIKALVQLQQEILEQAALLVKLGGRLIYSTCTLEPEENQEQINWFLGNHPEYELVDFHPFLPETLSKYLVNPAAKWVTILPITNGGDGFFICRMERR